jgi:hypothetical protein
MGDINYQLKRIRGGVVYLSPFVCLLLLGVMLNISNPLQAGPASILVVFILLYLLILTTLAAALYAVGAIWKMLNPSRPLSLRRWYYVMSVASIAPVLFVAINTLGQLESLEGGLIIVLVSLGCFYVLRRSAK